MKQACILLLSIGIVLTSPLLLAQTKTSDPDPPYIICIRPQISKPPGGLDTFQQYLQQNTEYPKEAIKDSITGAVTYKFAVDEQGCISNVEILKDIGGGCGDAVKKALESYDKRWTPAEKDGHPVKAYFTGTFSFSMQ